MVEKVYYVDGAKKENRKKLLTICEKIPCFFYSKIIEMDYIQCTFKVRKEDLVSLEKLMAPLV